jgi:hypothetical protein
MIKPGQIAEIISLYRKHGWILRRVLLSDGLRVELTDALQDLFGGVPIVSSDINAAWFSRASRAGQEAWELRRLSESPYALFETFDAEDEEEVREAALSEVEARMKTGPARM